MIEESSPVCFASALEQLQNIFYSKARMHSHFAMALCAIEQGV